MTLSRRTKVGLLLTLLVLASVMVGFVLGATTAKTIAKRKEDPLFWKPAAIKHLEKLHPTDAQRTRFQAIIDDASARLTRIRAETVARAQEIVAKAVADVERELTPEQQEIFATIKPKPAAAEVKK